MVWQNILEVALFLEQVSARKFRIDTMRLVLSVTSLRVGRLSLSASSRLQSYLAIHAVAGLA